jgi:hypothetical protein
MEANSGSASMLERYEQEKKEKSKIRSADRYSFLTNSDVAGMPSSGSRRMAG